ncbi:hypothetical protein OHB12_07120 [Nocardia sp. NBC_01730]|uniref:hypothetical protein n=1 Tax=Nocardia sp. NBC_01730 TaxID=2975998 RepID=UPI002E0EC67B|nr:hypothetical protein OHB12_07120 [Nocardia sp. NBC_01730]
MTHRRSRSRIRHTDEEIAYGAESDPGGRACQDIQQRIRAEMDACDGTAAPAKTTPRHRRPR